MGGGAPAENVQTTHADGPERHALGLAQGADVDGRPPEAPERQANGGGDVLDRRERFVRAEPAAR